MPPPTTRTRAPAILYSVGYDHTTIPKLRELLSRLEIKTLFDVRSSPTSRVPGFHRTTLQREFPDQYNWVGANLGGRLPGVTEAGLKLLVDFLRMPSNGNAMLLCKEDAPGACHRHATIALPLLQRYDIDVIHVYEEDDEIQLIQASELQASIDEDRDYDFEALSG